MTRTDYYVYVYFRPNGIPCYIGKGRGSRWLTHFKRVTNRHLAAIIDCAGGSLPGIKIHENLTEDVALEYEKALIKAIGREDNGGPLVNFSDGGEGIGENISNETKSLMSYRAKSNGSIPPSRKGCISEKRGISMLAEQKLKISNSLKEYNLHHSRQEMSIETRLKISIKRRGQPSPFKGKPRPASEYIGRGIKISVGKKMSRWFLEHPKFVSEFSNWGDGSSLGLLSL